MKSQTHLQTLLEGFWPQLAVVILRKQHLDGKSILPHYNLRLLAIANFQQGLAKCAALLVTPNAQQQQQVGMPGNHAPANTSAYLSTRCLDVDNLCLMRTGTRGIAQLMLIDWRSLTKMDLSGNDLEAIDMNHLVKASLLQLSHLNLAQNNIGANGIEVLVSGNLPRLEVLDLSEAQLDATAAEHLVKADWPNLDGLDLSCNMLDDMAMTHLANGEWPKLTGLEVNSNPVGPLGFERLSKGRWPELEFLTVVLAMLPPAALEWIDSWREWGGVYRYGELLELPRYLVFPRYSNDPPGQALVWPRLTNIYCYNIS